MKWKLLFQVLGNSMFSPYGMILNFDAFSASQKANFSHLMFIGIASYTVRIFGVFSKKYIVVSRAWSIEEKYCSKS